MKTSSGPLTIEGNEDTFARDTDKQTQLEGEPGLLYWSVDAEWSIVNIMQLFYSTIDISSLKTIRKVSAEAMDYVVVPALKCI